MQEGEIERIEGLAERMLAELPDYIWDGRALPVPVEDIVDSHYSLLVREVEDMTEAPDCPPLEEGQSLSGLLLAGRREIWVNATEAREWPPRRRFTIGHELGHWIMHRDQQASLFCRHGSIEADGAEAADREKERPPLPEIEEEANYFAAALLMPRELLRRRYHATASHPDRFAALCAAFDSSQAAMGRRLHQVI